MQKHKRFLIKWLQDFVEVIAELSEPNFRMTIQSGQSTLLAPVDIFETLKRRAVIERATAGDFYFFTFTNDGGEVMVKVQPDPLLKNGLVLRD